MNIAEYRETITSTSVSLTQDSYNRERLLKLDQLKVERDSIKKEIKRLDENIKNNKKAIELIDEMKLVIKLNEWPISMLHIVLFKINFNHFTM